MSKKEKSPLFKLIDSISHTKDDILESVGEKEYVPYVINKFLSSSIDTVFHANEMNRMHWLSKEMQYDYLRNSIRKKKRYFKWTKSSEIENNELVKRYFNCNSKRAKEITNLLDDEDIEQIKKYYSDGGLVK